MIKIHTYGQYTGQNILNLLLSNRHHMLLLILSDIALVPLIDGLPYTFISNNTFSYLSILSYSIICPRQLHCYQVNKFRWLVKFSYSIVRFPPNYCIIHLTKIHKQHIWKSRVHYNYSDGSFLMKKSHLQCLVLPRIPLIFADRLILASN